MVRYGTTTDYDYSATHKRQRIQVWSSSFYGTYEAEGYSLPGNKGYMLTTYNGDKVRVECPLLHEDTHEEVNRLIGAALDAHYAARGVVQVQA